MSADHSSEHLETLPLAALHEARGAKFGPFAGYRMPIQYPEGLIAEHQWTRSAAGLFDVSHMGPCYLALDPKIAPGDSEARHKAAAAIIERLCPSDIAGLKPGQIRYTVFLTPDGGVIDDLMVARHPDPAMAGTLYIVVNAAGKHEDFRLMAEAAAGQAEVVRVPGASLLALQGPGGEAALASIAPEAARLTFMKVWTGNVMGAEVAISRSGYTGEDGFEIFAPPAIAETLAQALFADARVKPIGLGARDSLRLEAGLCLYGHDLTQDISPVEADLSWIIQKRRRQLADFPGAERILRELKEGPKRRRVGLRPKDRAPAREGVDIRSEGRAVGVVTSGGFSPVLNAPISMGYVETALARPGAILDLVVRGQPRPAEVVALPFVPHRYKKDAS
jgi:aminomethyltransferase